MTEHPTAARPRRPLMIIVVLVVGAVLGLVAGLALGPHATPTADRSGDPRLIADVERVIGTPRGLSALSAARLSDGQVTYAGLGSTGGGAPTPQTVYELGSITKTFTGMLLADAVERGEVALDDPLARHLTELSGTPAGESTLRQLATHMSGLPTFPAEQTTRLVGVVLNVAPDTGWTTARVIDTARTTPVGPRGTYAYSNLGMSLLGHALARAADATDWATLARQRLLDPLQMTSTTFQPVGAPEPAALAQPHRSNGWPTAPWTSEGYEPAGVATRTTAEDMMRFARAVIEGRAPGMAALTTDTRAVEGLTVGLAWHAVTPEGGAPVVWHNGGTGGTRTMLALDLEADQAVLVMNNSSRDVDSIAVDVLTAGRPGATATPSEPAPSYVGIVLLGVALVLVASLLARALRSRDRVHLVTGLVEGAAGAALALVHGPWGWLPGWIAGVVIGIAVAGAVVAATRLPGLPTWPVRRRGLAITGLVVTVALLALVVASG